MHRLEAPNQSDARPWHLQELLPSNGCWRIVVFAGDLRDSKQFARFTALGNALGSTDSFLYRCTRNKVKIDSVFEVLTVHSAPRSSVELLFMPEIFHPFSEEEGWDYWKVFVDDMSYDEGHGRAYENYGIDPGTGCMIIIRLDQHVGWIDEMKDVDDMARFFSAFMVPQG
jgi:phenol 2-monooxygenase (NADPH)